MPTIEGKLVNQQGGKYSGYQVLTQFETNVALDGSEPPVGNPSGTRPQRQDAETVWRPASLSIPVRDDGSFDLTLPVQTQIHDGVALSVRAPTGEILHQERLNAAQLAKPVVLTVAPRTFYPLVKSTDPFLGQRVKITGRILDAAGKMQIAGKQVILWARPAGVAEENGFIPVVAAQTDRQGYFSADYPKGQFEKAYGVVAMGDQAPTPVRLEGGEFPKNVLLVVDLSTQAAAEEEHDCTCKSAVPRAPDAMDLVNSSSAYSDDIGGGCVNFTVPNRALEEFSFYSIVRTTEPEIKGSSLTQTRSIPAPTLAGLLGLEGTPAARARQLPASTDAVAKPAGDTQALVRRAAPVDPHLLRVMIAEPENLTAETLEKAEKATSHREVVGLLDALKKKTSGRADLTVDNPVDWDDTPTFYQATTIAHGHVLHFKQVWKADGYSLGDLLYSLPLAPCQKKQIVVLDWDRREVARRTEMLEEEEALTAVLSRDRDVSEIVSATLKEQTRGGSESDQWGVGGGLGAAASGSLGILSAGAVLGFSAGGGGASSSAWQSSSRRLAANSLQQLHDRTSQSASAVRSQRATVIQSMRQGETMSVQSEVVANHNHCHAVTMEYFEVLRHLQVSQELVDVQECLLIPLLMTPFDAAKALRWRETLSRCLRDRSLRKGFDAIERISNNYEGSDLPEGRYAKEALDSVDGELRIAFELQRPKDDADGKFVEANWNPLAAFLGVLGGPVSVFDVYLSQIQTIARDEVFKREVAPYIAQEFIQSLRFALVSKSGVANLNLDATLVSQYAPNTPLYVSLRPRGPVPNVTRESINELRISVIKSLPLHSRAIVKSASIRYRTNFMSHFLCRDARVDNDLLVVDPVEIATPLDRQELRDPRQEDKELKKRLLAHLNEHLEYYHRMIWWRMDPERRLMLLDGFIAPNSNGRSVGSVVENRLIGIAGNCLVMPVARGFHLDPTFHQDDDNPLDLLHHYAPATPIPPMRISLPTRGVFAEAVMGACNSCEKKDETRFWRFEESPNPDEPTAILPVDTETRRAEPANMTPTPLPAPIINLQNAPAAPDPTGLAAALQVLGTPNLFKDITGLEGTQKNSMAAMQSAMDAAKYFGGEAAKLAQQKAMSGGGIDKAMQSIKQAEADGLITKEQAQGLTSSALRGLIGDERKPEKSLTDQPEVKQLIKSAGESGRANVSVQRPGESVEVKPLEDSGTRTTFIDLTSANPAETRAFLPAKKDKSGHISLTAVLTGNPPPTSFTQWSSAQPLTFLQPADLTTEVIGGVPGLNKVTLEVRDLAGVIGKSSVQICVPQFVTIDEDAAAFDKALAGYQLDTVKEALLKKIRDVAELLLRRANVRLIWRLAPFGETLPKHLQPGEPAAGQYTTVTIRNLGSKPGLLGRTSGANLGPGQANETIEIYPGGYRDAGNDVGPELAGFIGVLSGQNFTDERLMTLWIETMSRLIGETIAHEIFHSLLGTSGFVGGHNDPPINWDIMNNGFDRTFGQRTGIQITDPGAFPNDGTYAVGPMSDINQLTPTNQARVDGYLPVPPKFQ